MDGVDVLRLNETIERAGCPARVLPRRSPHARTNVVLWPDSDDRGLVRVVDAHDVLRAVVELAALPGDHLVVCVSRDDGDGKLGDALRTVLRDFCARTLRPDSRDEGTVCTIVTRAVDSQLLTTSSSSSLNLPPALTERSSSDNSSDVDVDVDVANVTTAKRKVSPPSRARGRSRPNHRRRRRRRDDSDDDSDDDSSSSSSDGEYTGGLFLQLKREGEEDDDDDDSLVMGLNSDDDDDDEDEEGVPALRILGEYDGNGRDEFLNAEDPGAEHIVDDDDDDDDDDDGRPAAAAGRFRKRVRSSLSSSSPSPS